MAHGIEQAGRPSRAPRDAHGTGTRPESWRAVIDDVLMAHVRLAFAESGATYGAPRVHQELRAAGLPTSTKRVARQFAVHGVALNQVWIGDITYIPTREGFLYRATVLDLGSRRCVGWAMRDAMETELVTSALRMARDARHPAPGLIFHGDRGSQYTSEAYRTELTAQGMRASMSGKGDCYDNAVAERFFATLEFELVLTHDWPTREEARRAIFRYIETWYKRKRRHSTLGYVSPAEYEVQLQMAA